MKLSYRHIAIFGQVKVNLKAIDAQHTTYVTLLEFYQNGWWVTDRFGTIITLVKPRFQAKQGFCCICRRISTTVNLDTLDLLIKQVADVQYEQYKNMLKSKEIKDKIKKSKEDYYAKTYMSTLSSGNRHESEHVLHETQGGTTGKIQTKRKRTRFYRKKKSDIA